jgi:RNA polymerase subunit RPABC4/transcription elongation factor Spt4
MSPAFAIFGIHNNTLTLVVDLVILFLVIVWLATVYWTFADARRRIDDPMLIGCATAAALFPFIGTMIYTIVRPPEFLDDVEDRELSMRASEAQLAMAGQMACPHCERSIEREFLRCPHCLRKLKDPCHNCGKPLDNDWRICPFCEADVPGVTPPRRQRRRRDPETEAVSGLPPSDLV